MLGKSGRGSFLLGTAFGQRFTVAGNTLSCFTSCIESTRSGLLYGYACAAAEPSRAEIEDFLRDVQFVDRGFVEDRFGARTATDMAGGAPIRAWPDDQGESRGLTEVPLGYAVLNPIGGG